MPKAMAVGMASDRNVEAVRFALPQIHGDQRAYVYLTIPTTDGSRHDVVELVENQLVINGELAAIGGAIHGYAEVQDPDGVMLWHSDVFTLEVRALNDITGEIEKEFPSALQQAMAQTADDRDAADASAEVARAAASAAMSAANRIGNAEETVKGYSDTVAKAASDAVAALHLTQAASAAAKSSQDSAAYYAGAAMNFANKTEALKTGAEAAQTAAEAAASSAGASAGAADTKAQEAAQSAADAAGSAAAASAAGASSVQAIQAQQAASEAAIEKKTDDQLARIPDVAMLQESVNELDQYVNEYLEKIVPVNLLDPDTVQDGFWGAPGGIVTHRDSTTYQCAYIDVKPGEKYVITGSDYYAYNVNANGEIVSYALYNNAHKEPAVFDTDGVEPGTWGYSGPVTRLYFSWQPGRYPGGVMICRGTDLPEDYTPYHAPIKKLADDVRVKGIPATTVITAGVGGDYPTIRAAVESVQSATEDSRVLILVKKGDYDLYAEYGGASYVAALAQNDTYFGGLVLPDYVDIAGETGDPRDVTLRFEVPDAAGNDTGCNKISVLNLYANSRVSGLHLVAHNIRYAIHDESGTMGTTEYEREIRDCIIEHTGGIYGYRTAYAAGFGSGCRFAFENCRFVSTDAGAFSMHDRNCDKAARIELTGCTFVAKTNSVRFGSVNSSPTHQVIIRDCIINNNIRLIEEVAGSGVGCHYHVTGSGNSICLHQIVDTSHTAEPEYIDFSDEIGYVRLAAACPAGTPVNFVTGSYASYTAIHKSVCVGVTLQAGAVGDFVRIAKRGYFSLAELGLSGAAANAMYGVSNGALIVTQDAGDAIGIVRGEYLLINVESGLGGSGGGSSYDDTAIKARVKAVEDKVDDPDTGLAALSGDIAQQQNAIAPLIGKSETYAGSADWVQGALFDTAGSWDYSRRIHLPLGYLDGAKITVTFTGDFKYAVLQYDGKSKVKDSGYVTVSGREFIAEGHDVYILVSDRWSGSTEISTSYAANTTVTVEQAPVASIAKMKADIDELKGKPAAVLNPCVRSIGHRGDVWNAPECSASAVIAAKKAGFGIVENDTQKTSDGVYICWHDQYFNRLGNIKDYHGYGLYKGSDTYYWVNGSTVYNADYEAQSVAVSSLTVCAGASIRPSMLPYNIIKNMDIGTWFSADFAGERIMTLHEWLILCKKQGLEAYVDASWTTSADDAVYIQREIQRCGMQGHASIIGTPAVAVRAIINAGLKKVRIGILTAPTTSAIGDWAGVKRDLDGEIFYNPSAANVTEENAQIAIDADYAMEAWYVSYAKDTTVEQLREVTDRLIECGVSGITLDHYTVEAVYNGQ